MNSNNQEQQTVTFEVVNIQSAKAFPIKDNFFQEELEHAKDLIDKLLKDLDLSKSKTQNKEKNKEDKEDNHFHQHNSISVLGTRGMGKTSFILSLRNSVISDEELNNKIIWLPNLDPTRMEENETFLVTVVANILKKITTDHQQGDLNPNIKDKLELLSRDFAALAPQQVHQDQWKDLVGDPNSFAYEVLNKAHSGLSLARSFHEFLRSCLDLYDGKKVFIQPIDDVDSAIGQGWPIIETVRKYLATPHMITILSGDIDLYETLIRKQQFDKIKHLLANEDVIRIKKQVDHLTEQYLAKVMPFHLRVRLIPLTHRIMERAIRSKDFIFLKYVTYDSNSGNTGKENNGKPLSNIYANFISDLFNYKKPQSVTDMLKPQSVTDMLKPQSVTDMLKPQSVTDMLKPEFAYVRFLPSNLRDLIQLFKVFEFWIVSLLRVV